MERVGVWGFLFGFGVTGVWINFKNKNPLKLELDDYEEIESITFLKVPVKAKTVQQPIAVCLLRVCCLPCVFSSSLQS